MVSPSVTEWTTIVSASSGNSQGSAPKYIGFVDPAGSVAWGVSARIGAAAARVTTTVTQNAPNSRLGWKLMPGPDSLHWLRCLRARDWPMPGQSSHIGRLLVGYRHRICLRGATSQAMIRAW